MLVPSGLCEQITYRQFRKHGKSWQKICSFVADIVVAFVASLRTDIKAFQML